MLKDKDRLSTQGQKGTGQLGDAGPIRSTGQLGYAGPIRGTGQLGDAGPIRGTGQLKDAEPTRRTGTDRGCWTANPQTIYSACQRALRGLGKGKRGRRAGLRPPFERGRGSIIQEPTVNL